MLNLIKKFLKDMDNQPCFLCDKRTNLQEAQEVYFFPGDESFLCIGKKDNKVICKYDFSDIQIHLVGPTEFNLVANGQTLFFCTSLTKRV